VIIWIVGIIAFVIFLIYAYAWYGTMHARYISKSFSNMIAKTEETYKKQKEGKWNASAMSQPRKSWLYNFLKKGKQDA